MKYIEMRQDPDDPALVRFYVDGEQIENIRCYPGVRSSASQVEATAKITMNKTKRRVADENHPGDGKDVYPKDTREPRAAEEPADRGDVSTAKRSRKKDPQKDTVL